MADTTAVVEKDNDGAEAMKPHDIPLEEIYSDSSFNIRGEIRHSNVVELARNINNLGLQQSIVVQPYSNPGMPEKKYRIVLGHRRYAAFEYLGRKTIPAVIREGLSHLEALALNFSENINREDLNILEEAYGVRRFMDEGLDDKKIAKMVNKGSNWVRIRAALLKMPPVIQQEAAAGFLTQPQILDLSSIKNEDDQISMVKKIKEAKLRGETRLPKITKKKKDITRLKRRDVEEVFEKIEYIIEQTGKTNIVTRVLAWVNGQISELDLEHDLIKYFKEADLPYQPPEEYQPYLQIKKP